MDHLLVQREALVVERVAEAVALGAQVRLVVRVGRVLECMRLCRALWTGEPVTWDGRWPLSNAVIGPVPHRKGGPPIWMGGDTPGAMQRAAHTFDGWFPIRPSPELYGRQLQDVLAMRREAGRSMDAFDAAIYLTVCIDDRFSSLATAVHYDEIRPAKTDCSETGRDLR